MTQTSNPLRQFFRQPKIYLRLPSLGRYWPPGSLELPENGEIPILPMTAIDEITYRTPDALFNGQAVVSVIQSCCPNIKNAWAAPSVDIDSLLVAIRIASYSHELDMETVCPHCEHREEYSIDLRHILDTFRLPNYDEIIANGDLEIHFSPINYQLMHENNLIRFNEQRMMQMLPDPNLSEEEKVKILNNALVKITEMTVNTLTMSISAIKTPGAIVTDSEHINDFLKNCDRSLFATIRDHIVSLRESSEIKPLEIKCPACNTDYQQPFTLDQANFFAPAS